MNRRAVAALLAAFILALLSCSDAPHESVSTDAGAIAGDTGSGGFDAGMPADGGGGTGDAGAADDTGVEDAAGAPDAGVPDGGGRCRP